MQPTTPTLISILNQSSTVSDADCAAACPAFGLQFANDYAPVWGSAPAVEFVPKGATPSGNVLAFLVDAIPEAPGALGYHDLDRDGSVTGSVGMAYIKVSVAAGYDWRTTMSHELLELVGDFPANRWDDAKNGDDYAHEMCDACEADTYETAGAPGVPLSNFVYPAFFNPYANQADRLDHMGTLPGPFEMSPGGYQIKRTEPGNVTQVFARHAGHDCHDLGGGLVVVFGPEFPADKKAQKLASAQRRRGKAAA